MIEIQGYIILFIVLIISTFLLQKLFKNRAIYRLPPSPLAVPIIGHLHLLSPLPHQSFQKLSNQYGPLIHLRLGSLQCVVASSPEMAKEFLKTHEISFSDRPQTFASNYLAFDSQSFAFSPYGPYWKFMKKLCMSELLGGKTTHLFLPVRYDEIKCFIGKLYQKGKTGQAVDVGGELIMLTGNVISRMLMSAKCTENEGKAGSMKELIQEIAELIGKFNVSDFIWFCKGFDMQGFRDRLKDVRDRFDGMVEKIMNEHQEAKRKMKQNKMEVKDLLDILIDISECENSEIKLTKEKIKAFILDIFGAGTDTSAITIEWALAELINHPKAMQKAVQEIDSIVGKSRLVQESDIENLPYLQAIVKETLRLHPSGPMINRQCREDCSIGGYHIPAKTRLFVNTWAIHRDPKYWENPLEFQPERFLIGKDSHLDVRGQHYQYLPFGTGRRGCPGTSLVLQVVQLSLAAMIQCFEWKVNGAVNMEEGPGITLPRAHPLVCLTVSRLEPFPILFP